MMDAAREDATAELRAELEAAKKELEKAKSALSACERLRAEDGMSAINEQNRLRAEMERVKGLLEKTHKELSFLTLRLNGYITISIAKQKAKEFWQQYKTENNL